MREPALFWPWAVRSLLLLVPAHLVATGVWVLVYEGPSISVPLRALAWALFGIVTPLVFLLPAIAYLGLVWGLRRRIAEVLPPRLIPVVLGLMAVVVMSGIVAVASSVLGGGPTDGLPPPPDMADQTGSLVILGVGLPLVFGVSVGLLSQLPAPVR